MQHPQKLNPLAFLWMGALVIMPLLYDSGLIDPVTLPRTLLSVITLGLAIGWTAMKSDRRMAFLESIRSTPIVWLYGAFIFIGIITSQGSINSAEATSSLLKDSLFLGLFILMLSSIRPGTVRWIALSISIAGAIFMVYGLVELWKVGSFQELDAYQIRSTLGHKNLFSSASLFALISAVYVAVEGGKIERIISVIIAFLSLYFIWILQTRTVWLALAITLVVLVGLVILRKPLSRFLTRIKTIHAALAALFLLVGVSIFFTSTDKEVLPSLSSYEENQSQGNYTIRERALLWNFSKDMIEDHPIDGVGHGQWKLHFPEYGSGIWRARQGLVQFQRPHNDFIWVLSENGVFGFIAYGLIFLISLFVAARGFLSSESSLEVKKLYLFGFGLLLSYFLVANFSFPRERIFHQWILHLALAIIWMPKSYTLKKSHFTWPTLLIILGIFGFSAFVFTQRYRGESYSLRMTKNRVLSQWEQMRINAERAGEIPFYNLDPVSMPVDFYHGLALLNTGEIPMAIEAFEKASRVHPNNIHVVNNLGASHQLLGDHEKAIQYYTQAKGIAPYYIDGTLNLTSAFFNGGEVGSAYTVLRENEGLFVNDRSQFDLYMKVILETLYQNTWESVNSNAEPTTIPTPTYEQLLDVHKKAVRKNEDIIDALIEFILSE